MNYVKSNKAAWEEAFNQKAGNYAKDMIKILQSEKDPFIQKPVIEFLDQEHLEGKVIGHFCCNNGRELLSIAKRGIKKGYGFDVAKNMIDFANESAEKLNLPVTFIEANILDIDRAYHHKMDYLLITVGALCWFKDLNEFFDVAQKVLKKDGKLIINETHPLVNALATLDEDACIKGHEKELVHDYFKSEPWEVESMNYMAGDQKLEHKFYSFSHATGTILTSICNNGFMINSLDEYDYCISGLVPHLNQQGVPLSFLLVATKR